MRASFRALSVDRAFAVAMSDDAPIDENSPQYRAKVAAEREMIASTRRETAASLDCSAEEIDALTEASKAIKTPCWSGPLEECPMELKSLLTQKPLDLFAALRNPQADPDPRVWLAVREGWPVLADRSDEDLFAMLQPIKDVKVDRRWLK